MKLVDDQAAVLHARVAHAIGVLNDRRRLTPCQVQPAEWDEDDSEAAVRGCSVCPVLQVCSAYALSGAVDHGIVAGISMRELAERRRIQRNRQRRRDRVVAA